MKISLQDAPSASVLGPAPAPSWAQQCGGAAPGAVAQPQKQPGNNSVENISDLILPKWNLKAKRNYLHVCFKQIMFKPALWHRTQSCRVLIQVNKTSPWLRVSRAKRSTEYHTPVQYKLWSSACCATYLAYKFSCCTNPTQLFPWYHSNIFIASRLHVPKRLSHPYLCQAGCIARAAVQSFLSCIAAAQLQPKPWFHLPN